MFDTNVNGAHIVTSAFVPLLQKGQLKKVINLLMPYPTDPRQRRGGGFDPIVPPSSLP
jgi:hypothetical protein